MNGLVPDHRSSSTRCNLTCSTAWLDPGRSLSAARRHGEPFHRPRARALCLRCAAGSRARPAEDQVRYRGAFRPTSLSRRSSWAGSARRTGLSRQRRSVSRARGRRAGARPAARRAWRDRGQQPDEPRHGAAQLSHGRPGHAAGRARARVGASCRASAGSKDAPPTRWCASTVGACPLVCWIAPFVTRGGVWQYQAVQQARDRVVVRLRPHARLRSRCCCRQPGGADQARAGRGLCRLMVDFVDELARTPPASVAM